MSVLYTMYTYIYIYIYTHTHTYVYIYIYIYICIFKALYTIFRTSSKFFYVIFCPYIPFRVSMVRFTCLCQTKSTLETSNSLFHSYFQVSLKFLSSDYKIILFFFVYKIKEVPFRTLKDEYMP